MTALDLITSSLRLSQILGTGETPSADEANDALQVLNDMLDQWQAERLMIFTVGRQVFSLVPGQQDYTLGPGGDFDTVRPAKIESFSVILLQNPDQPMELPIESLNEDGWQAIPVKDITSSVVQAVWDAGGYPLRTLHYWPVPNTNSDVAIYPWTMLDEFSTLTTDHTFPPGYSKALRYCLAVDLCPEYGKQVDPAVAAQAILSRAIVKSINIPSYLMQCDQALVNPNGGYYNWRTDMPAGRTQY